MSGWATSHLALRDRRARFNGPQVLDLRLLSVCDQSAMYNDQYQRITRWEHEEVLEAMQKRLNRTPQTSRVRRQTVEHPFGTIKAWMGALVGDVSSPTR